MAILDGVDLRLLKLLQENARVSQHDLARAVGLSSPAVAERVRKLEERGVIRGYTAVLEPRVLGQDVSAFVAVAMSGSGQYGAFRARVQDMPEVLEAHSVTGEGSHLLKVRVGTTAELERLLAAIQSWPGVVRTTTSVVLSTVKESTAVPLPELEAGREEAEDPGPADLLLVPFRHNP